MHFPTTTVVGYEMPFLRDLTRGSLRATSLRSVLPLFHSLPPLPLIPLLPLLPFLLFPQLLDHRDANCIDDFVCVLGMEIVVVSKDRKQEPLAM